MCVFGRFALVALAAVVTIAAGSHRPSPSLRPVALLRDPALTPRLLEAAPISWHGGDVVAQTGETVDVHVSDSYTDETNSAQQWADFFAGLIHGSELALLNAYVATPAEVQVVCGTEAIGCYGDDELVVPGESFDGVDPQEVARHEYGHHVAASRVNPPWPAVDWGPKRWASLENVCKRNGDADVFPGDEGLLYRLNPGEAWAETYRVLNDARADPAAAITWPLVDASFLPSPAALDAAEQDVRDPWTAPAPTVTRARVQTRIRSWTLATPLDGSLAVRLSFPARGRYDLALVDASTGRVLAKGAPSGARSMAVTYLVCGQRSIRVRVTRRAAAGPVTLRVMQP